LVSRIPAFQLESRRRNLEKKSEGQNLKDDEAKTPHSKTRQLELESFFKWKPFQILLLKRSVFRTGCMSIFAKIKENSGLVNSFWEHNK